MGTTAKPTRENRTITVDFRSEATYFQLLGDGKAFLECVLAFVMSLGFQFTHKATCRGGGCLTRHSHYVRVRLGGLNIWRIQCTTCRAVFTVLPHFVLRYRSMPPEVARDALLATHGGLSLEWCAVIYHISPMALYRLLCACGRQSLVTVRTRCGLPLPAYFLADEKHSRCLTERLSGNMEWHNTWIYWIVSAYPLAEECAYMDQKSRFRKRYPSDLTDAQWAFVSAMIPPAKQNPRGGRPRKVEMREVLNMLFYLNRSGCQWNMLPHDLLPKSTVYDYFAQWRDDGAWTRIVQALREQTRVAAGREPTPSAVCIDSQSVKTTETGGPERGYDGGKKVKGRKRHILVDTLGLLIAVLITSAGLDDGRAAPQLLALISATAFPRLVTIFGDNKYHNHDLQAWMATHRPAWRLEVTTRPEGSIGFTPLRKRWVVERTNAWNGRDRRNSKDYERKPTSSAGMIQMSNIHLMLNRLSPRPGSAFRYHQKAA